MKICQSLLKIVQARVLKSFACVSASRSRTSMQVVRLRIT